MILVLLACAGGESAAVQDACTDAPAATWESFGAGFVTEYCQTCHASTAVERYGAPASVTFDTAEQVWATKEAVLDRTLGDSPSMPPQGGLTEDDKVLLDAWLVCGAEGS